VTLIALIVAAGTLAEHARTWWHSTDLRTADTVLNLWAADPANWCARPACPRCYGGPR
jgi:hypothetical protein